MLNIAYTHASPVLDFFHYCMLQNKQSNRYSLYSIAYLDVSRISRQRRELHKFYQTSCRIILTDLPNANKKMLDKISFHKHFKLKVSDILSLR